MSRPRSRTANPLRDAARRTSDDHDARFTVGAALAPIGIAWLLALAAALLAPDDAFAIGFDIEFRTTTDFVDGTETWADLLVEHANGTLLSAQTVSAIDAVSSSVMAGTNSDYSTLITTTFTAGVTGTYEFEVGTDWGLGGASQAVHVGSGTVLDTFITTNDVWWNNDWNDADVFSTVLNLTAGETYSIGWVGFEDCCGGPVTFRFSVNGAPPAVLDDVNFAPYEAPTPVPEPGTALLVAAGLITLGAQRRRPGVSRF